MFLTNTMAMLVVSTIQAYPKLQNGRTKSARPIGLSRKGVRQSGASTAACIIRAAMGMLAVFGPRSEKKEFGLSVRVVFGRKGPAEILGLGLNIDQVTACFLFFFLQPAFASRQRRQQTRSFPVTCRGPILE